MKREAEAIGPYDMMFYSEVSKDLSKLLDSKDEEILSHELQKGQSSSQGAEADSKGSKPEESKASAPGKPAAAPAKTLTPA